MVAVVIDRKTGRHVGEGDSFKRRGFMGIQYDYEIKEFIGTHSVRVTKTIRGENPVTLTAPMLSLQLDYVVSKDT